MIDKEYQIRIVEKTLKEKGVITCDEAMRLGVRHLRAHIHFLRLQGYVIDNPKKKTYKLI